MLNNGRTKVDPWAYPYKWGEGRGRAKRKKLNRKAQSALERRQWRKDQGVT